ncbi:hypothetical protein WICMUC_003691 [Wickerhamomyces mucosus]|uniref:PX domain-containing protein n=1 Tax=Wickerhamomyces mucosus TaxID=1378264 RepID=A0A9P8PK88_9ASCO|nr:hypothetical protein WICMUC_003691 [Wickerhamomyces mucosus]
MDSLHEEDNNPFSGSDHIFADGIGSVLGDQEQNSSNNINDGFNHPYHRVDRLIPNLESSATIFGDSSDNSKHSYHYSDPNNGVDRYSSSVLNSPQNQTAYDVDKSYNHDSQTEFSQRGIRYSFNEADSEQLLANTLDAKTAIPSDGSAPNIDELPNSHNAFPNDHQENTDHEDDEYEEDEDYYPNNENQNSKYANQTDHLSLRPVAVGLNSPITITEALQTKDPTGHKVVLYTINYHSVQIRRRYSEFDSFRNSLKKLFPTVIIPPIPEKHSMISYFFNPISAKSDTKIIEKRKRLLTGFLRYCFNISQIKNSVVWKYFLTPSMSWSDIISSPPISILPQTNILAPPLDPVKPSPLHLLLPIPHSSTINSFRPREQDLESDEKFKELQQIFQIYRSQTHAMEKSSKKQKKHFKSLVRDLGELGAFYNAFSLEDNYDLATGIERTGQAIDVNFINSEAFSFKILTLSQEPLFEFNQFSNEALGVLKFRKLKEVQLYIIDTTIKRRKQMIESLQNAQEQSDKLEEILRRNAEQSPTIAAAVKRLEQGESINKVTSPWRRIFSGNKASSNSNDIASLNEQQRKDEIEKLQKELDKLNDCLGVVLKDLKDINRAIDENIQDLLATFHQKWKEILKDFANSILIWLDDNLKAWEDAKEEIQKIEVQKPALIDNNE